MLALAQTPVEELVPYAQNARTHSPEQIKALAASIEEFGFCNPVLVDEAGEIIAGHGRVLAAQQLGQQAVPTIELAHLNEAQRKAYRLADNQLAQMGSAWDLDKLKLELDSLEGLDFDLTLLGFDRDELDGYQLSFGPVGAEEQSRLDEKAKTKCPECGHEFEA